MEKENLDDLMREKFDTDDPGARFEFREEYWEQAQVLLEADERKRKRRFLWWWWLGAGCLLLAVGGWFWYANTSGSNGSGATQVTSQPKENFGGNVQDNSGLGGRSIGQDTKSAGPGNDGNPAGELLAETPTTAASGTADDAASRLLPGSSTTAGATTTSTGATTTTAGANAPGNTELDKKTIASKTKPANQTNPTDRLARTPALTDGTLAGVEKPQGSNSKSDGSGSVGNPTRTTSAETAAEAENKWETNSSVRQDESLAVPTGLPPSTANAPQPTGAPAETVGAASAVTATAVVLPKIFPVDFQILESLSGVPFFPKATPVEREIKPLREPRLGIGVGASALAFFSKNRALQVGGTAGIFADYRLNRSFSLSAGAAWRYIPMSGIVADSTNEPQVSEQLRYSFGYKQLRTSIRPTGLHTMELPLLLRWHRGAWYLEGGASVSRLLGVRADMATDSTASLQPLPLTSKKKIWTDTESYRQTWLSPMAGAGWQRGRWSVSLRAVLFPLDVVPPMVPDGPRATGWRPSVDIGLRYRIW